MKFFRASITFRLRPRKTCAQRIRSYRPQSAAVFFLFLLLAASAEPSPRPAVDNLSEIRELVEAQRWQEVVQKLRTVSPRNVDQNYYYGIALAQLKNYREAGRVLLAGRRQQPRDKRFATELAGVAFKQKKYPSAVAWLRAALKLDPSDAYANDFLATVYFLQGNLEAALKYWNRVSKPTIENVTEQPPLRIDPALLDRAFAFSPASMLTLADLATSESRIEGLGIFPVYRFQLNARADNNFDLVLEARERNGWGVNRWDALISTLRGIFYQTIYPEYFNLHGSATNLTALLRWDAQKRRALATISGPLWQDAKYRYGATIDLRNENWKVITSFTGPATVLGGLNLRRESLSGQIASVNSGRWNWSTGVELSHRDYRSIFAGAALTPALLLAGFELKQRARLDSTVLRIPERRFLLRASVSDEAARIWTTPSASFLKVQGSLAAHWLPRPRGNDYEVEEKVGLGKTVGQIPFDELFMLGLERDNDLPLRAHIGTRDGRKGSAPLGRNYFLSNWEINKNVYNNGLFGIRLSPFLDVGKISDPDIVLGSRKWLFDSGLQIKFHILNVGLTLTYGKDLRSGANAFYFTTQP